MKKDRKATFTWRTKKMREIDKTALSDDGKTKVKGDVEKVKVRKIKTEKKIEQNMKVAKIFFSLRNWDLKDNERNIPRG